MNLEHEILKSSGWGTGAGIGAALGAGAGGLSYAALSDKERKKSSLLKRTLLGALLGGGAGAAVGGFVGSGKGEEDEREKLPDLVPEEGADQAGKEDIPHPKAFYMHGKTDDPELVAARLNVRRKAHDYAGEAMKMDQPKKRQEMNKLRSYQRAYGTLNPMGPGDVGPPAPEWHIQERVRGELEGLNKRLDLLRRSGYEGDKAYEIMKGQRDILESYVAQSAQGAALNPAMLAYYKALNELKIKALVQPEKVYKGTGDWIQNASKDKMFRLAKEETPSDTAYPGYTIP